MYPITSRHCQVSNHQQALSCIQSLAGMSRYTNTRRNFQVFNHQQALPGIHHQHALPGIQSLASIARYPITRRHCQLFNHQQAQPGIQTLGDISRYSITSRHCQVSITSSKARAGLARYPITSSCPCCCDPIFPVPQVQGQDCPVHPCQPGPPAAPTAPSPHWQYCPNASMAGKLAYRICQQLWVMAPAVWGSLLGEISLIQTLSKSATTSYSQLPISISPKGAYPRL